MIVVVLQSTWPRTSPSHTWRHVSTWGRSCSRWAGRTSCRTRWRATRARCVQRVDSLRPHVHHTLSQVLTSSSYMSAVCPSVLCSLVRWCGSSVPWRSPRPSSTWWSSPNASTASWISVRTIRSCCWKLVRGTDTGLTGSNCVCHSMNYLLPTHSAGWMLAQYASAEPQIRSSWMFLYVAPSPSRLFRLNLLFVCADALLHTQHSVRVRNIRFRLKQPQTTMETSPGVECGDVSWLS